MILIIYLIIVNIVAFVCYGVDKWKAKNHRWRIPEAWLIALAAIGGALGALLGMLVFHHKTRKTKFRVFVPLFLILWVVVVLLCVFKVVDLGI